MKKYKTIIADPPWQYKANHDRNGSARGHYTTMSDADITAMPALRVAVVVGYPTN